MMEAMLFGHRKGTFTGATASSDGLFQAANGGTLFLDEIAELPLSLQAKLLRALQEGEVLPVGATHAVPVDVRVIAAGNRDLAALCNSGQFRSDLYRSEEHTSELQSLMRISYAVFCLKKKTNIQRFSCTTHPYNPHIPC